VVLSRGSVSGTVSISGKRRQKICESVGVGVEIPVLEVGGEGKRESVSDGGSIWVARD
jgi:hypothetical protein